MLCFEIQFQPKGLQNCFTVFIKCKNQAKESVIRKIIQKIIYYIRKSEKKISKYNTDIEQIENISTREQVLSLIINDDILVRRLTC